MLSFFSLFLMMMKMREWDDENERWSPLFFNLLFHTHLVVFCLLQNFSFVISFFNFSHTPPHPHPTQQRRRNSYEGTTSTFPQLLNQEAEHSSTLLRTTDYSATLIVEKRSSYIDTSPSSVSRRKKIISFC